MRGIAAALLAALLLAGCAGASPLTVERRTEEVQRYHPPAPVPVQPVDIEIEVLTYEVTRAMNEKVEAGEAVPYTYFAMSEQDYLTLGQWMQDALRYIRQSNAIIEFYRSGPGGEGGPAP